MPRQPLSLVTRGAPVEGQRRTTGQGRRPKCKMPKESARECHKGVRVPWGEAAFLNYVCVFACSCHLHPPPTSTRPDAHPPTPLTFMICPQLSPLVAAGVGGSDVGGGGDGVNIGLCCFLVVMVVVVVLVVVVMFLTAVLVMLVVVVMVM